MLRVLFCFLFLISCYVSSAQKSVNDYKYVVVPDRYDFHKEDDRYQLNSLSKFLFNKYGFNVLMKSDNFPNDLASDGCKGLQTKVVKNSGFLTTKLVIELLDCNGKVVFKSSEGTSKEKEYKKAYHEALRDAFDDVRALRYVYSGGESVKSEGQETDIKSIAEEKLTNTERAQGVKKESEKIEVPKSESISYTFNGDSFVFELEEFGYTLKKREKESLVTLGRIYKMSRDNTFLIDADVLSGGGHFDGYGNFIIERINPATKSMIIDTLARQ